MLITDRFCYRRGARVSLRLIGVGTAFLTACTTLLIAKSLKKYTSALDNAYYCRKSARVRQIQSNQLI